jgi:cytochrome P450
MNEALRLYPPAWVLARRALRAAPFDGYTLPANATVMLSPYLAGRDLRWFDDSLTFRPARWLDGLAKRLPAFAFFPFGGGAHVCTGQFFARMEIRLVLATVAARFRLSYRDSAPVGVRPQITLSPDRPIELIPET